MAITQVRAQFGGQWYTLAWNSTTRRYECTLTPTETSHHQPGGAYSITLEATNDSGVTVTADGTTVPALNLTVNETTAPVLAFLAPTAGYITDNRASVVLTATDEAGGSGVDPDTLVLTLDGAAWAGTLSTETVEGGFRFSFAPEEPMPDGLRTVRASIRDHDGNLTVLSHSFTVDTVPPQFDPLAIPVLTDAPSVLLTGEVSDKTAPSVTVTIRNNGAAAGTAEIESGTFSLVLPLTVGENHIELTATDGAGLKTVAALYAVRLITDRTPSDASRVLALAAKGWAGMTAAEKTEWAGALKGAYNASDTNRVAAAVEYLAERFTAQGYAVAVSPVTDRAADDSPTEAEWAAYLGDVAELRRQITVKPTTPALPETIKGLTVSGANAIEQTLRDLDELLTLAEMSCVMSGEAMTGEF